MSLIQRSWIRLKLAISSEARIHAPLSSSLADLICRVWCRVWLVADRLSGFALDGAHNRRENRPRDAAAGDLTDDASNIRRRSRIGEQGNKHAEDLSADATTNGSGDRVSKRSEINVFGSAPGDIAADGTADDLYDQIDE
ncbi:hypothetical protein V1281_003547 [Nitrobacteraceae bacterium AZCC 2161]